MLLVFGSINVDFVFPVVNLPHAGDTVWSSGPRTEVGGKGANQAVAAARDGMSVVMVGAVGRDSLADDALSGLGRAGVQIRHVAKVGGITGRSAILVDPSGYTMVAVEPGANAHARAAQVDDALLGPRTTLLVQMETDPVENASLILRARARGARIILNFSPPRPIDTAALRALDVLVGNSSECAWAGEHLGTGNNPGSLHALLGVATVRVRGVQGSDAMSDEGFLQVAATPVHMRDTTGAADCYAGVFAAALARGRDLSYAMRRASAAAALSTTRTGAANSFPHAADIEAAFKQSPEPTSQQSEVMD